MGAIWVRVRGDCPGAAGPRYAYADAHRVRTKNESLMIVIDSEGQVERLEVLSFDEPPEYQPKPAWYEKFKKQKLSEDFDMGRAIPFVTGASLTTRSTVQAARRVLAVHAQIHPKEGAATSGQAPVAPSGDASTKEGAATSRQAPVAPVSKPL